VFDSNRPYFPPWAESIQSLIDSGLPTHSETTGRQARLIELDPKYVDVIVTRWQDYTGRKAVLENDGREFEQIAHDRFGAVLSTQRFDSQSG